MAQLLCGINKICKVENKNGNCINDKNSSKVNRLCSSQKYEEDENNIICSSIEEEQFLLYDEECGCWFEPKIYMSPSSSEMVTSQEYETFKPIYDFLDNVDIMGNYKEVLCLRFVNMPMMLKLICKKFLPKLNCVDTNANQPRFSPSRIAIFINQFGDLNCPLGTGNQFMHEVAHGMAYLMVLDGILSKTYDKMLAEFIKMDYYNAIVAAMNNQECSQEQAEDELSTILTENGFVANTVSDVFGGVSENRVRGCFVHDYEKYWKKRDESALGREFFASIFADMACCNDEHIAFAKQYMPLTMLKFEEILKGIILYE